MRVLHVVSLVSPDGAYGGPVRVATNLAVTLHQLGHDVTIAAGTRGFDTPPTGIEEVPARLFSARQVLPRTGFAGLAAPSMLSWFRRAAHDFDLIHVHLARDLVTLPLAALALRLGKRVVLQTHGMVDPSARLSARLLDRVVTRHVLRSADTVLHLTDRERQDLLDVEPSLSRLVELPNGVPIPEVPADPVGAREVLFLARLHERKRPLHFAEAALSLAPRHPEWRFTLAGPDEGQAATVRAALVGPDQVSLEGAIPPEEVSMRLRRAAIYVLPSVDEPFPMSVLEAMALGLPVVVTDSCGLAPIIDASNAGAVTNGEVDSLVTELQCLLTSPEQRGQRGANAREAARHRFDLLRIGTQLQDVYKGAMS